MTTETGEGLEGLATRIAKLERQIHRLKSGLGVALLILAAVVLWDNYDTSPIKTEGVSIVDREGRMRIFLSAPAEGGPMMGFSDAEGRTRIGMSAIHGWPSLSFYDEHGRPRSSLSFDAAGPSLIFHEKDATRLFLGVFRQDPMLKLYDEDGSEVWAVGG